MASFYSLTVVDGNGQNLDLASLRGKVVLIVNVASKCGFSYQYQGLQMLHETYSDAGLVILAFPCNQFGHQEPGTAQEIAKQCQRVYGVTFPILSKIDVNGRSEDPVYTFLKSSRQSALGFKGIKWNFEKFLIDRAGNVVGRFASTVTPGSLAPIIKRYLED